MAASEADLAKARKDWQEAITEAAENRKEKESSDTGAPESPEDMLARIKKNLSGLGNVLDQAAKKTVGVKGTFNAAAVRALAGGDAADRTAKATEKTAKSNKQILDELRAGGKGVFV